ncbi:MULTISPECIES: lysozyme inhibitor LprI family protein [unclassified Methylobacterium]|uniref:lysozyme inhibitor LprI family protein n=1 Tax=unclassified Methylobacterium TaxID=2615210 RepID=UPI0011C1D6FE|nr:MULTISPECIES: lysozyme inhibitor LprI family protein [unclassified Methylobacterium]QEE41369.1 DUF1311 domain-containing protein [Methylobacterium sp. WL1]TXN00432.1 DUF1311 domain-containing protein [Methylobacterium sp. WL64]TXN55335.1 DUF1311 domain-containing protein [Methylobacterium sp. WL2]
MPSNPFTVAGSTGILALAALWTCALPFASARADQPSAKLCRAATSTPETQTCLHKALEAADAKLNAAYKKALSVIEQDDRPLDAKATWKAQFTAAQRAWIAFRDADCGDLTFSEWNNGSGTTGALYACRYDKTVQRTEDILSRYPLQ